MSRDHTRREFVATSTAALAALAAIPVLPTAMRGRLAPRDATIVAHPFDLHQVRLLPGNEEALPVRMRVSSAALVPAQELEITLRIRSMSQAPAHADLPVLVTVPAVDVPATSARSRHCPMHRDRRQFRQ